MRRALAAERPKRPDDAEVDVDGEEMDTEWDEPAAAWMQVKRAAVRRAIASLVNDPENLPQVGRRVDRIVRQTGAADIYFDDGSWVSATVDDPEPRTSEQARVLEEVYGEASPAATRPLVVAARNRRMLGVLDARAPGATDPRLWRLRLEAPFDLYLVRDPRLAPESFKMRDASARDWRRVRRLVRASLVARVR